VVARGQRGGEAGERRCGRCWRRGAWRSSPRCRRSGARPAALRWVGRPRRPLGLPLGSAAVARRCADVAGPSGRCCCAPSADAPPPSGERIQKRRGGNLRAAVGARGAAQRRRGPSCGCSAESKLQQQLRVLAPRQRLRLRQRVRRQQLAASATTRSMIAQPLAELSLARCRTRKALQLPLWGLSGCCGIAAGPAAPNGQRAAGARAPKRVEKGGEMEVAHRRTRSVAVLEAAAGAARGFLPLHLPLMRCHNGADSPSSGRARAAACCGIGAWTTRRASLREG